MLCYHDDSGVLLKIVYSARVVDGWGENSGFIFTLAFFENGSIKGEGHARHF